jgi:ribosome-associated toxin RatA of RatAB toxin-antitoxin module
MTTQVDKTIMVDVPVRTAYDQWTQFEEFPQFMGGVREVRQLDDRRLHWVAEIAGVRREWEAEVIEQVPDQKVAWAATDGATNAGAVFFRPLGENRTEVRLHLEYEPEGVVEKVGDKLSIVEKQAQSDLEKFKSYIESRGAQSGGWRGEVEGNVGTPDVEAAEETRGDSGKAGVSGKAVAAGVVAAAAGVAAAAAVKGGSDKDKDEDRDTTVIPAQPVQPVEPVVVDEAPADTTYGTTVDPERDRPLS